MFKVTMRQPSNRGGYSLSVLAADEADAAEQVVDYARTFHPIGDHTATEVVLAAGAEGKATLRLTPPGRDPIRTPAGECRHITVELA